VYMTDDYYFLRYPELRRSELIGHVTEVQQTVL